MQRGFLPDQGGWLDQARPFVIYMDIVEGAIQEAAEYERKAQEARQDATQRRSRFVGK